MVDVDLRVLSASVTKYTLNWKVTSQDGIIIRGFNIYYTETLSTPLVRVNQELVDGMSFTHVLANYNKFPRAFYQVEAIDSEGNSYKSGIKDIFERPDLYTQQIIKREMFDLMSDVVPLTLPVALYQRRTSGKNCPRCSPGKQMGPMQNKCIVCFGTGYEGGFYEPVVIFINYESLLNNQQSNTGLRIQQENQTSASTSSGFGYIRINDYIREILMPNRLFCVSNLQSTESLNRPITYRMSLQQEESEHPLYMLSIPTGYFYKPEINAESYMRTFETYAKINDKFRELITGLRSGVH